MRRVCLAVFALGLFAGLAHAETPQEKGLRIVTAAYDAGKGFGSAEMSGEMILRDSGGNRGVRSFHAKALEIGKGANRTLIVFDRPRDIAGTALLTYFETSGDQQWVYFPSIKRVKRISATTKTSSFAGSEFTYEDLTGVPIDRFRYNWLREEPCPQKTDLTCDVIERYPLDRDSGYRKHVFWMDQNDFRIFRIDFYDRKDTRIKTLTVADYKKYKDKYWRATQSMITNLRTGKNTVMKWNKYNFDAKLSEGDFSRRALERVN
jgi:hypothetical protein